MSKLVELKEPNQKLLYRTTGSIGVFDDSNHVVVVIDNVTLEELAKLVEGIRCDRKRVITKFGGRVGMSFGNFELSLTPGVRS